MATPAQHAPAEVLQARCTFRGREYALTLVASLFANEGSALLERLPADDVVYFVQNGEWKIGRGDDAPATLGVDFDDLGDIDDLPELLDKLMGGIVAKGLWGIEGYSPLGDA